MTVVVDYTSKDYPSLVQGMLSHASLVFPQWTSRAEGDFGVMLVEAFAYMGDILSYYGDRIVNESYLGTATQRSSILRLAALLGYAPNGNIAAVGTVTFKSDTTQATSVLVPAHTQVVTGLVSAIDAPIIYETDNDATVPPTGGTITTSVTQGETVGTRIFILHPGAASAETIRVEDLGVSTGAIDQRFTLAQSPVILTSVRVFVDQPDSSLAEAVLEYYSYQYIIDANPTDRAFVATVDDKDVITVQLGDGINGDVPPVGLKLYAAYRVGGGIVGNVAGGLITDIASAISGISVLSSTAMTGGVDKESNDLIRANAPRVYQTQNRAVTLDDYASLAMGVTAVSKAKAVANSYTNVSIYVVAAGGTTASQALLDAVTAYVSARSLAGATVTTMNATLIAVNVGSVGLPVNIGVLPTYSRATVKTNVIAAIRDSLSLLHVDFGTRVSLSSIYQTIASVPGVDYASVAMMARSDSAQTGTADIFFRPWEIAIPGSIEITTIGGVG